MIRIWENKVEHIKLSIKTPESDVWEFLTPIPFFGQHS
jgi:hypothetical protein